MALPVAVIDMPMFVAECAREKESELECSSPLMSLAQN